MMKLRRRSSTNVVPRRCSSAVSLDTTISPPLSSSSDDKDDEALNDVGTIDSKGFSLWNILNFDSLNLQSTSWRNKHMLAAATMKNVDESTISYVPHYGVDVCFIPQLFHYTAIELKPYRLVGDPEMDELLQYLSQKKDVGCGCGAFDDVISYAAKEYQNKSGSNTQQSSSPAVQFYKHYYENIPDWVDFDQIQRGINVFLAYLPVAGCSLFYRSLVGGFSIPEIVQVLIATRYLVPSSQVVSSGGDNTQKSIDRDRKRSFERLLDTGGFVASCFAPPPSTDIETDRDVLLSASSLRPGGKGWDAALRVRVLHAKVRRSLLQSTKTSRDAGQTMPSWDTEKNGIPINQEDMAATLLAFSTNVLLGIEIIAGKPLPEQEQRDYLALWRYIGWLLGVDTVEREQYVHISSSNASKDSNLIPIDPCGPRKLVSTACHDHENDIVDSSNDSIIHSYATLESMILHLLHPEESSCNLVAHLLNLRRFFLFRSETCRKFLGHPLSDKLGIPMSTIQWKGWRKRESLTNVVNHIGVKFFLYLFLLILRCYTLLTMAFPSIRKRAIIWHGVLQTKFLLEWQKMNCKRMATKASALKRKSNVEQTNNSSYCPFSMIMPPD